MITFFKFIFKIFFYNHLKKKKKKFVLNKYELLLNYYEKVTINFYGFIFKVIKFENYKKIPLRHVFVIEYYKYIEKYLKFYKFSYFLSSGCLLGAARQYAFAGRPNDLDIGIIINKNNKNNLKYLIQELKKKNFIISHSHKCQSILIRKKMLVELELYFEFKRKILRKINGKNFIFSKKKFLPIKKISIYNFKAYVPKNYLNIIRLIYGKNWLKPTPNNFYYK